MKVVGSGTNRHQTVDLLFKVEVLWGRKRQAYSGIQCQRGSLSLKSNQRKERKVAREDNTLGQSWRGRLCHVQAHRKFPS